MPAITLVKEAANATLSGISVDFIPPLIALPSISDLALAQAKITKALAPVPPAGKKEVGPRTYTKAPDGSITIATTFADETTTPPPQPPTTGDQAAVDAAQNTKIAALEASVTALQTQVANLPTGGTGGGTGVSAPWVIAGIDPYNAPVEAFGIKAVKGVDDTSQAQNNSVEWKNTLKAWLAKTHLSSVELKFGAGTYAFAETLRFVDGALRVRGLSNGLGNANTLIRTPPGVDMCQLDAPSTNGWLQENSPKYGATGVELDGLTFWSRETPNPRLDPTYYRKPQANGGSTQGGILCRTYATLRNIQVLGPPGYGFTHVGYSAAGSGGNVNYAYVENCTAMWCGDFGFMQMGSDGNQNLFVRCNSFFNGGGGIADCSFLGNHFISPGYDGNGWFGVLNAPYPSLCTAKNQNNQWIAYQLLLDHEGFGCLERAKTVAPGTDWSLWIDVGPIEGPVPIAPEWKPNMKWCVGGYHVKTNPNAVAGSIFGYVEDGQVRSQWNPPGVIIPGPNNTGYVKGSQQVLYITGTQS